ncbi:MAG: hypothetical protein ACYC3W_12170 [Candidatus Nanopelagicales bacterium]
MHQLDIAIIARDKFSLVNNTLLSLVTELLPDTKVYLFDSGYPQAILQKSCKIAEAYGINLNIIQTERFANTNLVWNQFCRIATASFQMCLENDVVLTSGCIANTLNCLIEDRCDIAVPVVIENKLKQICVPHFNPVFSDIVDLPDGSIESILNRGRSDEAPMPVPRTIKHLERHCFIITNSAAKKLGDLDEQMYCRTDYDMSIQAHVAGLVIRMPRASVIFTQYPELAIDHQFFNYRWNIGRVAFANARLITKWKLKGFKTTIAHAYEARKQLCSVTT